MDLGDYPLELDRAAMERLTAAIREFEPTVILTHAKEDPFNPDHGVAYAATEKARQLASGAGVASAFKTIRPPALLLFEPHQPELYTTKSHGMGMGLAISRSIIEAHNGRLWVTANAPRGAVFQFTLPCIPA